MMRLISFGMLLGALALQTGCTKPVTVPRPDPTPPEVLLTVLGLGDPIELTSGGQNVSRTVPDDAEIVLLASGVDEDGGVKNITINGAGQIQCSQNGLGQIVSIHYVASNPDDPDVGVGDVASDRRLTTMTIKVSELRALCTGDFSFESASVGFQATAENFHGGRTTSAGFSLQNP